MKSHAFVRENAPRAILYGQIQSQESQLNDSFNGQQAFPTPHSPCPEFSKFLYFIFAPTLIYRDSYPRTSSVRWKYVITQLAQFVGSAFFGYYLFYRFCLPVFRHFKSEHVTVKIFVLSILNCTLPGALLLFCGKLK
jgi:sterol O-acyltransferase